MALCGWCVCCVTNYCFSFDLRPCILNLIVPLVHRFRIKKTALCGGFKLVTAYFEELPLKRVYKFRLSYYWSVRDAFVLFEYRFQLRVMRWRLNAVVGGNDILYLNTALQFDCNSCASIVNRIVR